MLAGPPPYARIVARKNPTNSSSRRWRLLVATVGVTPRPKISRQARVLVSLKAMQFHFAG